MSVGQFGVRRRFHGGGGRESLAELVDEQLQIRPQRCSYRFVVAPLQHPCVQAEAGWGGVSVPDSVAVIAGDRVPEGVHLTSELVFESLFRLERDQRIWPHPFQASVPGHHLDRRT